MTFGRVLCWFGRHDFTRWRRVPAKWHTHPDVHPVPMSQRRCKRCGKLEVKVIDDKLRPPTAADTVQRSEPQ